MPACTRACHQGWCLFGAPERSTYVSRPNLFEVSTTEEFTYGDDDSSVVVRFEREKGSAKISSDKRLYQRVMRLITDPATFGFETAEVTRLILRSLPISFFAPLNRLGDVPYTIDSTGYPAHITIDRNAENAAASSAA